MAAITASMVGALRAKTDAPMMECKKALTEAGGDMDRAVPLARRAWSLDRDNPATADTLGWLLFQSGHRAEGLVLLQQAARGAPSDSDIRRRLAEARAG